MKPLSAEELTKIKIEEVRAILKNEGKQKSHQFQEWWDVFQILSYCRKCELSEMESHSILSNRFELKHKYLLEISQSVPKLPVIRTLEEIRLASTFIHNNKSLSFGYREDVIAVLDWVLGGAPFDGLYNT